MIKKLYQCKQVDLILLEQKIQFKTIIYIKGAGKYKVEISNLDEIGNIYKMENMLKSFENKINTVKEQIAYNEKQLIDIKKQMQIQLRTMKWRYLHQKLLGCRKMLVLYYCNTL